jgi:hypothetical protein
MKLPQIVQMDPIPVGANPFNHDAYNMGVQVSGAWTAMYDKHIGDVDPAYIIMVNSKTGQRFKLLFNADNDHSDLMHVLCVAR